MNPFKAATLIVEAIETRGKSEEKAYSRFQLSHKSLSLLCQRHVITTSYMHDLSSELLEMGWCCFQVTSSSYAFLKLQTAQNFRRLNGETLMGFLGDSSIESIEGQENGQT